MHGREIENNSVFRDQIYQYAIERISENERHLLERDALSDAFLFDALEGYQMNSTPRITESSLKKLKKRILQQQTHGTKNVFTFKKPLRIAAVFIILISALYILNPWSQNEDSRTQAELVSPTSGNLSKNKDPVPKSGVSGLHSNAVFDTQEMVQTLGEIADSENGDEEKAVDHLGDPDMIQTDSDIAMLPTIPAEVKSNIQNNPLTRALTEFAEAEEEIEVFAMSKIEEALSIVDSGEETDERMLNKAPSFPEKILPPGETLKLIQFIRTEINKEKDVFHNLPPSIPFIISFNAKGNIVWVEGKSSCELCNRALAVFIEEYFAKERRPEYKEHNMAFTYISK